MKQEHEPCLFCDGSSGIYIPQRFAREVVRECVTGVSDEDYETLERGPEPSNEWYWEAWEMVLNNAELTDTVTGVKYFLHQDGDLWALPEGYEGPLLETDE